MTNLSPPSLPMPPALRGIEIPSFTHDSIVTRLPDIARRTLDENAFTPQMAARIQQLIDEIPSALIRPLDMPLAPDAKRWQGYIQPYLEKNWLEVPWFFAEEYFYQRILAATGYFHTDSGAQQDPYAYQKRRGLETTTAEIQALSERLAHELSALASEQSSKPTASLVDGLRQMILIDLWGNQNDLSMWPASDEDHQEDQSSEPSHTALREAQDHILDNQLDSTLAYLMNLQPAKTRIDILMDNAGFEMVCDLALADFLLSAWGAAQVVLHLKIQPVFVSDALETDILQALDFLASQSQASVQQFAARLNGHYKAGRLVFQSEPFWTSPLPMWQAPAELVKTLAQAHLLISKGDANYRRLLGDLHWDMRLPFAQVVDYLPMPVLALRTLKSDIATGIQASRVPHDDPTWMHNGRWGLVQFSPAQAAV